MTPTEITQAFYELLIKENLPKKKNYVEFTNKNWERYDELVNEFCKEHKLVRYDNYGLIQQGVMRWLEGG